MNEKDYDRGISFSRKVIIGSAAIFLGLSAASLTTSSFAWFAIGNQTYVRNINVNYTGESFKLAIMKDGEEKSSQGNIFAFDDEIVLEPVSSSYAFKNAWSNEADYWYNTNLDPEVDSPKFTAGDYSGAGTNVFATKGFYSLELRFSCDQDVYVYIDGDTQVKANHEANFLYAQAQAEKRGETLTEEELEERANILDSSVNATRISFFSNMGYTILDPHKGEDKDVFLAGPLDIRSTDGYFDFEGLSQKEIIYGDYDHDIIDEIDYQKVVDDNPPSKMLNVFDANLAKGTYGFDREETLRKFSSQMAHEKSLSIDEAKLIDDKTNPTMGKAHPIAFVPGGKGYTRTIMTFYVEGWDTSCIDAVKDAAFTFDISFAGFYAQEGVGGAPSRVLHSK